nr:hypothetical protein [Propionicimonas sp.]
MTTPALSLLTSADDWARDILLDAHNPDGAANLFTGWVGVMHAADAAWRALPSTMAWLATGQPVGAPFEHASITATQIGQDTPRRADAGPDPRMQRVTALLDEMATSIRVELDARTSPSEADASKALQLRAGILHVGYLLTHATATSTARQAQRITPDQPEQGRALWATYLRIHGVEQILDAHLHRRPGTPGPANDALATLDRALNRWLLVAYTTRSAPPDPMVQTILADSARNLVGNCARLAILATRQGRLDAADVSGRLLPALEKSAQGWEDSRGVWSSMLTPTSRQLPELVAAARELQQALLQPDLAQHPAARTSVSVALTVAAEIAVLNQHALADPGFTLPASTVATMTREALERWPNAPDKYPTLVAVGTLEGRAPTPLPKVLRADLNARGSDTLDKALAARSAGYVLIRTRDSPGSVALHNGQTGPARKACELPTISSRPGLSRAIGL